MRDSVRDGVRLEPWGEGDLGLVEQLFGDPRMMQHLGGAQPAAQNRQRLLRYAAPDSGTFKIVDLDSGDGVGFVGFWALEWQGEHVLETGWSVIPAFQGRGIATAAAELVVDLARASERPDDVHALHAFPAVENIASNALCQRLGFTFLKATVFGDPPRPRLHCNDWRLDLDADPHPPRTDRGSPSAGSE